MSKPILISAARLFDGNQLHQRPRLQISEGNIQSVEYDAGGANDQQEIVFADCTILPGLIDTHVHLMFSGEDTHEAVVRQVGRESDEELYRRAAANSLSALQVGITTVRDCGGKGDIIQKLRNAIRSGRQSGADVVSCGTPITTTTGHCHWLGLIANSKSEVQRAADQMIAQDADWLKIMATGGNMTPSSDPMTPQYSDDILKMVVDIGRKADKHSAAHVLCRRALHGAVAANYRTIEHCDWRVEENRYEFDPNLAAQIRDQGQFIGLTMSGSTRRAFLPQVAAATDFAPVRRLDARFSCERRMLDFGLQYTLHSDAGVRWTPIDQFVIGLRAAEVELHLTPTEILRSVTATAAEALDLNDRGRIKSQKRANLLIVEGDPTSNLAHLGNVRAVFQKGRQVEAT